VEQFIRRGTLPGKKHLRLSKAALGILHQYSWPGNIRELQNVIERAVLCEPRTRHDRVLAVPQQPASR